MTWGGSHISVTYGRRPALVGVDIEVRPGEVTAVVGGDGAGKTTLLKLLAGIGLTHTGRLTLPPLGCTGYVPPDGGIFRDLTIDEHLEFIAAAYRLETWTDRAVYLLGRTHLGEFRDRLAGNLSGGQQRKLAAAMALLPRPQLLVLDEPTTGIDPVSRMGLWRLIAGAAATGAAVVLATSNLDEAERAAAVVLLHDGRVLVAGTPDEIIAGIPGAVFTTSRPIDPVNAWRQGSRWRQWDPGGSRSGAGEPSLADAAIVAELMARGGPR